MEFSNVTAVERALTGNTRAAHIMYLQAPCRDMMNQPRILGRSQSALATYTATPINVCEMRESVYDEVSTNVDVTPTSPKTMMAAVNAHT